MKLLNMEVHTQSPLIIVLKVFTTIIINKTTSFHSTISAITSETIDKK